MTDQPLKTILSTLVTLIEDNITTFGLVTTSPIHSDMIADDQYPACLIIEMGSIVSHAVTSTTEFEKGIVLRIVYKTDDTDFTEEDAQDLIEEVSDLLATPGNVNISNTCISFLLMSEDPPINWVVTEKNFRDLLYSCKYEREK